MEKRRDLESVSEVYPKTFFVTDCAMVKNMLIYKGWEEVKLTSCHSSSLGSRQQKKQKYNDIVKYPKAFPIPNTEKMNKIINFATFLWIPKASIVFQNLHSHQIVNRFPFSCFTTKVGLSRCLQDLHGLENLDSDYFFPRCYKLGMNYENQAFIEDYHLTTCICILKCIVDSRAVPDASKGLQIPRRIIDITIRYCEVFMKVKNNEVICEEEPLLSPHDWAFLLRWYFHMLSDAVVILRTSDLYQLCSSTLSKLRSHWPQLNMEGKHNLWIVKPAAKSRGMGIRILQNFKDIVSFLRPSPHNQVTHVIQKYIERPLLIDGTKFDIRQWFLISTFGVFTIYLYEDCYIRFCSKAFSLKDFSEFAHLCNNSVQCHYTGRRESSDLIPDELMWTSDSFKQYLDHMKQGSMWTDRIYPGMKNAIVAAVQASKGGRHCRQNCFELYGADFLLSEDFHPWLLEINSNPCMAPTTQVTKELCRNVIKDTIKVVLDRLSDPDCSIGKFQEIYHEAATSDFVSVEHLLEGIVIPNPNLYPENEGNNETEPQETEIDAVETQAKDDPCHEPRMSYKTVENGTQRQLTTTSLPTEHASKQKSNARRTALLKTECREANGYGKHAKKRKIGR